MTTLNIKEINYYMTTFTQHIIGKIMPSMNEEEFASLKQDIATNGLTNDTITIYQGQILDGWHRYQACVSGSVTFTANQFTGDSPITFVLSNANRRNLTAGQKAALAVEVLPMLEEEAKQRMLATQNNNKSKTSQGKFALADKGQSRDKAATLTGASGRNVSDAKKIKEENKELFAEVKSGAITINDAKREIRRTEVRTKLETISANSPMTPTGKFDVIVIDPPWPIAKIERDVTPEQVALDYPTMTIEEIKALPILNDYAATDSHVFLWTTQKYLPQSFDILQSWGANYVFTMVWHKNGGFQPFNLPQYNCEFVLYGKVGNPQFLDTKAFPTCFSCDRTKHSEKPQAFYDLLNRVTGGRKLDYFNRRKIEGFIGFGNEAIN